MAFGAALLESLQVRRRQVPSEIVRGDTLEHVLNRHLQTVEQLGEGDLLTSILLLSDDGKRLSHGAAPNLPKSYREAIDGSEIGASAGSCGTAAYLGEPVYVTDIASDPLWDDYRDIALRHGLRSCWSTPIRDKNGAVIGTFAIYHPTPGEPTREEIDAIDMITEHVAEAILLARSVQDLGEAQPERPRLQLVADNDPDALWPQRLLGDIAKLETLATELEERAEATESEQSAKAMLSAVEDCRSLAATIREHLQEL